MGQNKAHPRRLSPYLIRALITRLGSDAQDAFFPLVNHPRPKLTFRGHPDLARARARLGHERTLE